MPADQIKHIRSDLTIVNGTIAHDTGALGTSKHSVSVKSPATKVLRHKGKRTLQLSISAGEPVRVGCEARCFVRDTFGGGLQARDHKGRQRTRESMRRIADGEADPSPPVPE